MLIISQAVGQQITTKNILLSVFPIIFNEYWFITSYVILILLVPLLVWIINNNSQKETGFYILLFLVVGDILPILPTHPQPMGGIFSTTILIVPFLIGAFINKYNLNLSVVNCLLMIVSGLETVK